MIVVKVELWPGGDCMNKETIARAEIWNTSNLADVSNYAYRCLVPASLDKTRTVVVETGTITGYLRKRLSVWYLVNKMLQQVCRLTNP